jgi:hypothetical protein
MGVTPPGRLLGLICQNLSRLQRHNEVRSISSIEKAGPRGESSVRPPSLQHSASTNCVIARLVCCFV